MLRKKLRLSPSQHLSHDNLTLQLNSTTTGISKYFTNREPEDVPSKLLEYALELNVKLKNLNFNSPVHYIYNPTEYAYDMYAAFLRKYCKQEKKILLLGLNPGPWGMVQTGIPFGEINMVKNWYAINEKINKPEIECPERKIMGLECHRSEISGRRLCELFQKISVTPEVFFQHTFLYNFCPLALMEKGGRNVTPSSLKGPIKKELEEYCSKTLVQVLNLLKTEIIIALGVYTKTQAERILENHNMKNIPVIYMPHPSPRVVGNENWGEKAEKVLKDNDLLKYFSTN